MATTREAAIAATQRRVAEFDAIEALCVDTPPRRRQDRAGATGTTSVLSVRLEHGLVEALQRRAALTGLAPSSLARNLIRLELARRDDVAAQLVDELGSVTERLRKEFP